MTRLHQKMVQHNKQRVQHDRQNDGLREVIRAGVLSFAGPLEGMIVFAAVVMELLTTV